MSAQRSPLVHALDTGAPTWPELARPQHHDEGVPALLATARTDKDAKIRRSAIFWLGQSEDPRALAYFEEVLAKGPTTSH